MNAVFWVLVFAGLIFGLSLLASCISASRSTEPRPYIAKVEATGKWAICIDADNRQPIFRQFGYVSDAAALADYEGKRPHIAAGWRPVVELNADGRFVWKWNSWVSEQDFASPFDATRNIEACRAAILDHADPLMVYDLTL
jgi:hypothetical protein